jgi:hypothetical protein
MSRTSHLILGALFALGCVSAAQAAPNWAEVGQALGKTGTEMAGGVYRVGLPRTDLHVQLDGIELKPSLALGSWVAFDPMDGNRAMVMGDLVLTEDEVEPVMKSLLDSGLQVTALHNHLFNARPATFYMHIDGTGDPVAMAKSIHAALAQSKTPFTAAPAPATPPKIDLDTAAIDAALGAKGNVSGGVYQVGVPRAEPPKAMGMPLGGPMGGAESINFQPLGGGKAAITGDFILTAAEVEPVLRALRTNGIDVTAIHNHMLDDQPRMFFVHYWAHDDVTKLLTGLKSALAEIAVKKP